MNFAIAIVALFIGTALQARLPAFGIHLEFLPALVAYGALTFGRAGMLALALAAGFTQDALSAGPFGVTAISYTATALFVHGYREAFDRELAPLQIGAGVLITVASSLAACFFAGFHVSAIWKITLLALLAALLTPILFFVLDFVRYQVRSR